MQGKDVGIYLSQQLENAKEEVRRLEHAIATAPCAETGHDWQHIGGCNAGCGPDCGCSVPVNKCSRCGDCDYGQNYEAEEVRRFCAERKEVFDLY